MKDLLFLFFLLCLDSWVLLQRCRDDTCVYPFRSLPTHTFRFLSLSFSFALFLATLYQRWDMGNACLDGIRYDVAVSCYYVFNLW